MTNPFLITTPQGIAAYRNDSRLDLSCRQESASLFSVSWEDDMIRRPTMGPWDSRLELADVSAIALLGHGQALVVHSMQFSGKPAIGIGECSLRDGNWKFWNRARYQADVLDHPKEMFFEMPSVPGVSVETTCQAFWACVLLVAKRATTTESALADASELMKDLELHGEEGPGFVAEFGAMLSLMMDGNAKH